MNRSAWIRASPEMARRFPSEQDSDLASLSDARRARLSSGDAAHPGMLAMEKVLNATLRAGATEQADRSDALRRYETVIRAVDDRTTLDLMLDGMATTPDRVLGPVGVWRFARERYPRCRCRRVP